MGGITPIIIEFEDQADMLTNCLVLIANNSSVLHTKHSDSQRIIKLIEANVEILA